MNKNHSSNVPEHFHNDPHFQCFITIYWMMTSSFPMIKYIRQNEKTFKRINRIEKFLLFKA